MQNIPNELEPGCAIKNKTGYLLFHFFVQTSDVTVLDK